MKLSRIERSLRTGAIFVFSFFLLIIFSGQIVKDSGPAEWLSALLNLVMAVAAVAACNTARSWLPQLTTQEGYKQAITLVNQAFITLGKGNRLNKVAWNVQSAAENRSEETTETSDLSDQLKLCVKPLEEILREYRKREGVISMALFRMQTYGLEVSPDRAKAMHGMLKAHQLAVNRGFSLVFKANNLIKQRKDLESLTAPYNGVIREERQRKLDVSRIEISHALKSECESIQETWKQMIEAQEAFFGDDHRIDNLFIVRKG